MSEHSLICSALLVPHAKYKTKLSQTLIESNDRRLMFKKTQPKKSHKCLQNVIDHIRMK